MTEVDLLLRGGAIALAAFLILHLARARFDTEIRLAGIAFLLGVAGYSLAAMPSDAFDGPAVFFLARMCPAMFWWFALCLFDARPRHGQVAAFAMVLAIHPLVLPFGLSNPAHQVITALAMGHVIYVALTGLPEDLVAARRAFRISIGVLIPAVGLAIAWFEVFPIAARWEAGLLLLQSTVYLVFALGFALWMTALDTSLFVRPRGPAPGTDPRDAADLERISSALASGLHRTEGLTITAMAAQLDMPEHRLRKLINHHLGYRNFSEVLNDLRIDEAKARLADADEAQTQIAQIAYAVGYSSLAPFNRAFRQRTGQSPSEFRRDALDLAQLSHGNGPVMSSA